MEEQGWQSQKSLIPSQTIHSPAQGSVSPGFVHPLVLPNPPSLSAPLLPRDPLTKSILPILSPSRPPSSRWPTFIGIRSVSLRTLRRPDAPSFRASDLELGYAFAHGLHHARDLVTGHHGEDALAPLLGSADGARTPRARGTQGEERKGDGTGPKRPGHRVQLPGPKRGKVQKREKAPNRKRDGLGTCFGHVRPFGNGRNEQHTRILIHTR